MVTWLFLFPVIAYLLFISAAGFFVLNSTAQQYNALCHCCLVHYLVLLLIILHLVCFLNLTDPMLLHCKFDAAICQTLFYHVYVDQSTSSWIFFVQTPCTLPSSEEGRRSSSSERLWTNQSSRRSIKSTNFLLFPVFTLLKFLAFLPWVCKEYLMVKFSRYFLQIRCIGCWLYAKIINIFL